MVAEGGVVEAHRLAFGTSRTRCSVADSGPAGRRVEAELHAVSSSARHCCGAILHDAGQCGLPLSSGPAGLAIFAAADGGRGALRDRGHGRLISLFAQGLHPADQALPRRLPLLHLRRDAARRRSRPISRPRGAGDRPRRRRGRLHRGAVHPGRQAGAALPRGARGAGGARVTRRRSPISPRCARLVLRETGLLPHANPGVMTREEIAALREVTASQGIMLESTSERLCEKGGVHYGSPDKHPAVRLETIAAGRRAEGAVHHRHPDRHRRDARGAPRGAAAPSRDCTPRMATSRKSSSRTSAPSPTPSWPKPTEPDLDDLLLDHRRGAAGPGAGR